MSELILSQLITSPSQHRNYSEIMSFLKRELITNDYLFISRQINKTQLIIGDKHKLTGEAKFYFVQNDQGKSDSNVLDILLQMYYPSGDEFVVESFPMTVNKSRKLTASSVPWVMFHQEWMKDCNGKNLASHLVYLSYFMKEGEATTTRLLSSHFQAVEHHYQTQHNQKVTYDIHPREDYLRIEMYVNDKCRGVTDIFTN
jgi:hypothetical protein